MAPATAKSEDEIDLLLHAFRVKYGVNVFVDGSREYGSAGPVSFREDTYVNSGYVEAHGEIENYDDSGARYLTVEVDAGTSNDGRYGQVHFQLVDREAGGLCKAPSTASIRGAVPTIYGLGVLPGYTSGETGGECTASEGQANLISAAARLTSALAENNTNAGCMYNQTLLEILSAP